MAPSNRDRVGKGFELLAEGMRPFVEEQVGATAGSDDWFATYVAHTGRGGQRLTLDDPQTLLNVMDHFWQPVFRRILGRSERSMVFLLRDARNRWAHNERFSQDETYRALDGIEVLLRGASASEQEAQARDIKDEMMRARYAEQERRGAATERSAITSAPSAGLPSWRDVIQPHHDVATGTFQQAEFAADLAQVHRGEGAAEYRQPAEFFRRTYLTQGLRDLLTQAVQRVAGTGGQPVIDLQTTFGGGKTHSLLALYHLFSGTSLAELPADVRSLAGDVEALPAVRRAVLVGTSLSPGRPEVKDDGTRPKTLWGELAWQLGGAETYALLAEADDSRTSPGGALAEVFRRCAPCLVLVDEWVAYARQLYSRDDLPGGSFDTHFTFAQTLTEAARAVPGALVVVSIPASEGRSAAEEDDHSSDVEVGGLGGREALRRLKSVIGRMESPWRPASPEESFEIVRRRLFEPMGPESEAARSQVAQALANLYRSNAADFPADSRQPGYTERLEAAYPIHPELFDRLYNDWSTLERFQRTRGVLRLMAAVVHALWVRNDQAPVILPASVPLDDTVVRTELVRHLEDTWDPILDQDVDGPSSLPARLDLEVPTLGRYLASRRVARTVFLGSAPTLRSANRGVEAARVRLGCALPGESVATFGDALNRLSSRSTYLYSASGRYWFGTQPGVTRLAAERCERLLTHARDDVHAEIEKRLKAEHDRGDFGGVHVAPASSADVPDDPEVRLVVLGPSTPHIARSEQTAALAAAKEIYERRGGGARERRNMVLFLAADHRRIEELDAAVAEHLAWASIDDEAGDERLGLDPQQRRQAASKRRESNDAVKLRLAESYVWALVPSQPDPQGPVVWEETPVAGQGGLFVRASRKLVSDGVLYTTFAPALLRMQLDGVLAPLWADGHVEARVVWDHFTRYPYLPRLASEAVLLDSATRGPSSTTWQDDAFALADAMADGRYAGLVAGEAALPAVAGTLLVRPEVAVAQRDVTGPMPPPDNDEEADGGEAGQEPGQTVPPAESRPTRFTGAVRLEPDRVTRDFTTVVNEVVAHLAGQVGARVAVTVEVVAEHDEGFSSGVVRTVSENARVLRFTVNEFEGE